MARWHILGLALCSYLGVAWAATLGVVLTEGGFVKGENKKLGLFGGYVDIFRGIPFAAPTKTLQDPEPHPGWDGTLETKEFKPRCLQMKLTQTDVRGSEDCLYLNIWIPQGRKQISTKLPVMVYIYGGAFLVGGSQGANFLDNYLYDGEEIAVRGNVIVVTVNYRLGPLGFLSTGDENMPGNYGLKDQHMAIAWVKRNIKAFGGDPDNITIFGESAGATSVSLQVNDPSRERSPLVYKLVKGLTVDRGEAGANATYNIYTQSWGDKPTQEVVKKTVVELMTDYIFLIPTQKALDLHVQNAKSGKTYSYVFSQPSRMPVYPSWVGADHADDLQYVFGKPFATPLGYKTKHRTVSKAMIAYWTNFASTGDPNKGNSEVPVSWPAYTSEGKYYLDINNKMSKSSVKQDLRSEYVNFWNSVYLQMPQVANISQAELLF
ncbi:PREDICTED: bile salt-activated lipase [Sturnus vulgaris]|uniref:bile salt-activated lipase n=1 Tax=Sturnus vulgaris TaxID=9172 RepID=UPI00071A938F|nr:PREDICTED: bile salt-activated lipase [Sturnus vulgaris]